MRVSAASRAEGGGPLIETSGGPNGHTTQLQAAPASAAAEPGSPRPPADGHGKEGVRPGTVRRTRRYAADVAVAREIDDSVRWRSAAVVRSGKMK